MVSLLWGSMILGFLLTFFTMPFWIKKVRQAGLVWEDMNKYERPKNIAGSGGIVVVLAFVIGVLYYVAVRTFVMNDTNGMTIQIFALLSVVLILTIVGIIDDLLGWKNKGLSIKSRLILAFIASIPLVVINAGSSFLNFPFFGEVNLGLLYPLILVPLGIAGATTTYNFLAGFNGLEAGQGIIILSFLSFVSYTVGIPWLSVIGLTMVASILGFWFYNKNPARVFPGDSLTWSIGALIACMAILGNFEKIALFVFIPYIMETGLKLRGNLRKQSFGKPNEDGSLDLLYEKIYGLEHLAIYLLKKIKKSEKVYENDVVWLIHGFQILFVILAYLIFM
ncbi:MAG: glycosyl transferase family 4 [Nanoarchaeota archaeon]|nr:glycosyl transferase family 4 [Nanoarchaeota archaeon]